MFRTRTFKIIENIKNWQGGKLFVIIQHTTILSSSVSITFQIFNYYSLRYFCASLKKETVQSIDNITTGNAAMMVTD